MLLTTFTVTLTRINLMKIAVVVPSHKEVLPEMEEYSFLQCLKVLGKYPVILVCGESTDCSCYKKISPDLLIERFDDSYFSSARGYNELMVTSAFYERFEQYDYILIYQLDAWVFRDELEYWATRNYDYIGAPFSSKDWDENGEMVVGNGGLSLRNVKAFLSVLNNQNGPIYGKKRLLYFLKKHYDNGCYLRMLIPLMRMLGFNNNRGKYFKKMFKRKYFAEDLLFRELSDVYHKNGLKYAPFEDAIRFSWEHEGERFFSQYGVKMPFACHAWEIIPNHILHNEIKKQIQLLKNKTLE